MIDDNKISIDIEINANGQQQFNLYNKAFDNLRTSIGNLSTPINSLNQNLTNLTGSISKLNEQNNSVSTTITNVGSAFSNVRSIFDGVEETFKLLKIGASSFTSALTGGVSLVLAFLPEIISLVGSFFKGKEAVAQMTDKLKGFNETMKAANSDTSAQKAYYFMQSFHSMSVGIMF